MRVFQKDCLKHVSKRFGVYMDIGQRASIVMRLR